MKTDRGSSGRRNTCIYVYDIVYPGVFSATRVADKIRILSPRADSFAYARTRADLTCPNARSG